LPSKKIPARFENVLLIALLALAAGAVAADDVMRDFEQAVLDRLSDRPQPSSSSRGSGTVIYVGDHPNCDESNLEVAIAIASEGDELRLQNQTFTGDFHVHGKSLAIIGGFENCAGSQPNFSSTLEGEGFTTVLEVTQPDADSSIRNVRLENLTITNGIEIDGDLQGGGVHIAGDRIDVVLHDVVIQNNETAARGGGLMAIGNTGPMVTITGDSIIQNNIAEEGGGLACVGPAATPGVNQPLLVIDTGLIWLNEALRGGGVYANNCTVISYSGGFLQGISYNTATLGAGTDTGFGGGIFAENGSGIGLFGAPGTLGEGDPDSAAQLVDNTAEGFGGGAWVGDDATMSAVDARIAGNAANRGGGVYVGAEGEFTMSRADESDCREFLAGRALARCSSLSSNSAPVNGGALTLFSSTASISQTYIDSNDSVSSIFRLISDDLTIEGSVITNNRARHLVVQTAGSALRLAWSTIADNVADNPSNSDAPLIEAAASDAFPPSSELLSSIFWNPGRDVYLANPTANGTATNVQPDCLVANELASLPSATGSVVQDPAFKDAANDDYRIEHLSPAVDLCDDSNDPPGLDIEQQPRGVSIIAAAPDYDAGADEQQGVILSDGFESG
jgi:hypothetical protein